jgi:hypothetical protein
MGNAVGKLIGFVLGKIPGAQSKTKADIARIYNVDPATISRLGCEPLLTSGLLLRLHGGL